MALCLWREARGESREAKVAIKHVILNRANNKWELVPKVILRPLQFSSFNRNDPNATKFPMLTDKAFAECCEVVDATTTDPTGGANHYESCNDDSEPSWANDDYRTAVIGPFEFYKL